MGTNNTMIKVTFDTIAHNKKFEDFLAWAMNPKRIIKSGDRTIVFWKDGTKTIVKRSGDAKDDIYNAFTAALAKKYMATTHRSRRSSAQK